ncbi:uncharacterized protein BDV17DRAFT_295212 [Aspergillus undulatus]|uniref:uncharacterized protein n=1 Tax=Aspergillus undulatus TaxID=1810928 RepID=UPI003CCD49E8
MKTKTAKLRFLRFLPQHRMIEGCSADFLNKDVSHITRDYLRHAPREFSAITSILPYFTSHQVKATSSAQSRYTAFQPTSILPIDTQHASDSVAGSQVWDERFKLILRDCLSNLFHSFVDTVKPAEEVALDEWLRAAIWWALRGKLMLEKQRFSETDKDQTPSKGIVQGLMDLAKAWWICHHVLTQDNFKIRIAACRIKGTAHSALFDQYRIVLSYLRPYERRLVAVLCTETDTSATIDVDKGLWVSYPTFTAYDATMLDNNPAQAWDLPSMAFGDTSDLFCYKSVIVEATLVTPGNPSLHKSTFPCVFSIMRGASSWQTVGVIASQIQLINIVIQSDRNQGPVWKDIEWDVFQHLMVVKLRCGSDLLLILIVKISEDSFNSIWSLAHHIVLSKAGLVTGENEDLLFDGTVKYCQYINHDKPVGFPAKPMAQCRVRLLKRLTTVTHGMGERKAHCGLRIVVATPPDTKALHRAFHDLQNSCPVSYSLLNAEDGSPGLLLRLVEKDEACSLYIYFDDTEGRTLLHSLILDLVPLQGETAPKTFSICCYAITYYLHGHESETQETKHLEFGESLASVIEQEVEQEAKMAPYGKAVLSEHLRVIIETKWSSITDRINVGPGQLTIALPVHDNTTIHLHRLPQEDLSMTLAHDLVSKDHLAKIKSLLLAIHTKPSIRIIRFKTQEDLHRFQEAVTGFRVRFDGLATRFLITRRRKLLPLMKQWDTNLTRVQLIQQGSKVQIVAFCHQFRHLKCLNFQVKTLDEVEKIEQKGEWGVRVKDAKYALHQPGPDSELPSSVCLDELEFPTEHSDIAILFGNTTGLC